MTPRSQEEILAKIDEVAPNDFLGFKLPDLVICLTYDKAKKYLKDTVTEEEWNKDKKEPTYENVIEAMKNYMEFAWSKANGCRGISAGRTMGHYAIWLWLLGDDMAEKFGHIESYEFYGKDNLVSICEEFGWDHSKWDDGRRSNSEY